ncbi:unnamed protein product [Caenorhabditis angaria]|uniref:G-protein coupled receptors family 1 profile domain-containing protein n=1 Tax=Caenorhabditis angaria TaxID=860376 RepID=A0A9P1INX0_9PELO|nr:unnamed protein product [Caenorhabditis angaria]
MSEYSQLMIYSNLTLIVFGILGNFTIVWITIANKNLHSRCNLLIGILAFFDLVIGFYLASLRFLMIFQYYNIPTSFCFYFSIYGLFSLNMQSSLGLIIGIDRLLNVSYPLRYSFLPKSIYVMLILSCLIFSFIITFFGYLDVLDDKSDVVVCLPPNAYSGNSRKLWLASNFFISICVIIVYSMAHLRCQIMRASNTHQQTCQMITRLMKSLSIVVGVYVCTWFVTIACIFFMQIVPIPAEISARINEQLGWCVIINASLNFFIYFWRTPEYRKAILRLYGIPGSENSDFVFNASNRNVSITRKSVAA